MADIMFLVEPVETGTVHAKQIFTFIGNLIAHFDMASGNIQIGHESSFCGGGDINIGEFTTNEGLRLAFNAMRYSWMSHMVKRLRTHLFKQENGGRAIARHMAVLFVDDKLYMKEQLIEEARKARSDDVELFVVAIGNSVINDELLTLVSSPAENHIIRIPSYNELMQSIPDFLDKFCYGELHVPLLAHSL